MYATSRVMRATTFAALPEVTSIVEHINAHHGSDFSVGTQLGGDPAAIGVTTMWEKLADYQAFTDSMASDEALMTRIIGVQDMLIAGATEDTIWSILRPPSEPEEFTTVNAANMRVSQTADCVAFALEAAEHISSVTGNEIGVVTAFTGDQSRLLWVGNNASLAGIQETNAKLMADADYLALFKRSEGLFVESTLNSTIWRTVPLS